MSRLVGFSTALGQADRAKDWMRRAGLIDPDTADMRYNFGCTLAAQLNDPEAALTMLRTPGSMGC